MWQYKLLEALRNKLQAWAFAASFLTPIEIIHILMLTIGVSVAVLPGAFRNKLQAWALAASFLTPIEIILIEMLTIGVYVAV